MFRISLESHPILTKAMVRKIGILSFMLCGSIVLSGQTDYILNDISTYFHSSDGPVDLAVCDLDGDGDMDLITLGAYKLMWHENLDGEGTMDIGQNIHDVLNLFGSNHLSAEDIDNDGDCDLVFGSLTTIEWVENLGNGEFDEVKRISDEASGVTAVDLVDIDNDGYLEILTSAGINDIVFWIDNGPNGFGNTFTVNEGNTSFNPRHTIGADIDMDGKVDIVVSTNRGISWYKNVVGGVAFEPNQLGDTGIVEYFSLADVDNDGDLDLLGCSIGEDLFVLFKNEDGKGNFGPAIILHSDAIWPTQIAATDLNGDGWLDIVGTVRDDDEVLLFYNDGTGTFGEAVVLDDEHRGASAIYPFDFDLDGDLDLVTAAQNEDKISTFENLDGLGDFGARKAIDDTRVAQIEKLILEDLDMDGDLDVVCVSSQDNSIRWFENLDGEGTYKEFLVGDRATDNFFAEVIDIDGDGFLDIVGFSQVDQKLFWYKNDLEFSSGFDSELIIDDNIPIINGIHVADADGDGMNDIFLWYETGPDNSDDGILVMYPNIGGNFGDPIQLDEYFKAFDGLLLFDQDGDGDQDLLVNGGTSTLLLPYTGNGFGPSEEFEIPGISSFDSGQVVDLNNDGYLDLLLERDGWITPVFSDQDQNLAGQASIELLNNTSDKTFHLWDMDQDDDLDLVVGSYDFYWLENLGDFEVFGVPQYLYNEDFLEVNTFDLGDIDNDGDDDLVFNSFNFNNLFWLQNESVVKNELLGQVSIDVLNNDCTSGHIIAEDVKIIAESELDSYCSFTNQYGVVQLFPPMGAYEVKIGSTLPDYYSVDNNPVQIQLDSLAGQVSEIDFCAKPTIGVDDVMIQMYPLSASRPGFKTNFKVIVRNIGTTEQAATVDLEFDDERWEYISSSYQPASLMGNLLSYSLGNILPFEKHEFIVTFISLRPPINQDGDPVVFSASVEGDRPDNTPDDNVFTTNRQFINSYDPNDIRVMEGAEILEEDLEDYLHYVIRFQNTGSASAVHVRVENILDPNLDWGTFEFLSASHDNRVEVVNEVKVNFVFENIYLPDSTSNELLSHGNIFYRIKPKADLIIGDVIPNQVDIFFDFNQAVTTNEVQTEVVDVLNIEELATLDFEIIPNPNFGIFKVVVPEEESSYKYELIDQLGQVLQASQLSNLSNVKLNPGVYYLVLMDGSGNRGVKLIMVQ